MVQRAHRGEQLTRRTDRACDKNGLAIAILTRIGGFSGKPCRRKVQLANTILRAVKTKTVMRAAE
jgi:hypothetical protein